MYPSFERRSKTIKNNPLLRKSGNDPNNQEDYIEWYSWLRGNHAISFLTPKRSLRRDEDRYHPISIFEREKVEENCLFEDTRFALFTIYPLKYTSYKDTQSTVYKLRDVRYVDFDSIIINKMCAFSKYQYKAPVFSLKRLALMSVHANFTPSQKHALAEQQFLLPSILMKEIYSMEEACIACMSKYRQNRVQMISKSLCPKAECIKNCKMQKYPPFRNMSFEKLKILSRNFEEKKDAFLIIPDSIFGAICMENKIKLGRIFSQEEMDNLITLFLEDLKMKSGHIPFLDQYLNKDHEQFFFRFRYDYQSALDLQHMNVLIALNLTRIFERYPESVFLNLIPSYAGSTVEKRLLIGYNFEEYVKLLSEI